MKLADAIAQNLVRLVRCGSGKVVHIQRRQLPDGRPTERGPFLCGISWWVGGRVPESTTRDDFDANPCGRCAQKWRREQAA